MWDVRSFSRDMSQHIHRIVRILSLLSSGARLTTSEIHAKLIAEDELRDVTVRQLQRDLKHLEAAHLPLRVERSGRELSWSLPTGYRNLAPLNITTHEVLSLHLLKGALGSFRGTRIEADVDRLRRKLERMVPGTVFMSQDVVSDISPGTYTNTISDDMLEQIVFAITDPRWDRVTYTPIGAQQPKTYVVSFCRLVNHAGRLYVVAWHPTHQQYITLAADRIHRVEVATDVPLPLHEFDEQSYRSARFGVYDGQPVVVKLRITADAAPYFSSRHWHPTEQRTTHRDGSMTLRMQVPISPELISWVMGWAGSVRVMAPATLISECRSRAAAINDW